MFSRAFSFKKKSLPGTTKAQAPSKVNSSNVLANRNVNVHNNSLVTKSPLTFSNKPERPQKCQINSYFSVSSKCKSDSISPTGNSSPASQPPPLVSGIKVTPAPTKYDSQFCSSNGVNSTSLNASLGFPMDDWDDLDDFETPSKAKNDSFSSEISGKSSKPLSSPDEEKAGSSGKINHGASSVTSESSITIGRQSSMEKDKLEHNKAAVSPGPGSNPAEFELDDSPIKLTRRRPLEPLRSAVSDSEDDDDAAAAAASGLVNGKDGR